ncbi:MAG: ATP-binding protein [Solirubrobacterales bacterium]
MSLRARILVAIGYVLLVAVVAFLVPLVITFRDRTDTEVRSQASSQAELLAIAAAEELREDARQLQPIVDLAAETVRGRVVVVDASGGLVADSAGDRLGSDFSTRPELEEALEGEAVQVERESATLGLNVIATAVPVVEGTQVVGAVRITQSVEAVDRAVNRSVAGLVAIGGVVMLIGLAAGVVVASQLARPMRRLTGSAERIAAGDLAERADVVGSSEQKMLASSFNRMTERLGSSLEAQREFVADASHQLRTPLTGMRLRLEEARAATSDPEAAAELDAALTEFDRLAKIIDELLLLSQIGEREAVLEAVDPGSLAEAGAGRWEAEAARRNVNLALALGNPAPVVCNAADAAQVIDALIENALLYGDGSDVTLSADRNVVEVLDRGPGLEAGEAEAVFERFPRGRAGLRGPRGSGLGLAIARGLAREWGGEVTLEERTGGGARAVLVLRAAPGAGRSGGPA